MGPLSNILTFKISSIWFNCIVTAGGDKLSISAAFANAPASEIAFNVQKDAFDYLDAPVKRVTCLDTPMAYSPTLVEAFLPNKNKLIKTVKEVMYKN